ncbi:putative bifunctional diguanylate cyclase/phosphodiesterase [Noviherbaspirillum pedocola]|uniref:EAL domain-containing protein n=1 Tax=Noviherbaspirillum pedocola TaxID=2801341 RepID=A0A934W5E3_9BURK|nr:EAL domain-containing protein [Noviherbaspirillum pedocola]MBK4733123.1 EAL domain-containing protein [Noviherbaspirillum pedocola]
MDSLLKRLPEPTLQQVVLLVDDQTENLDSLAEALEDGALTILKAASGEAALELLMEHEVALALVDVVMPDMDGYDLVQWMRGNSRTRNVPVLLLTAGESDLDSVRRGYEAGAIDYLTKPVSASILKSKVDVLLELDRNKQRLQQACARIDNTKAYYESMLNAAGEGMIGIDRCGRIRFANPAARTMLGVSADALKSADYSLFYPDSGVAEAAWEDTPFFHTLRMGEDSRFDEAVFKRADGELFPVSMCVSALGGNGEGVVVVFQDISARKALEEQVRRSAETDNLTGLNNRFGFKTALKMAVERARRRGNSMALMFVDLDHFKRINDTLGHTVGDHLLSEVAQRLRLCVRGYDVVARTGGDEFAVVLDELDDSASAAQVARKILDALRQPIELDGGMRMVVGASIGIACYPECSDDIDLLMQAAGVAVYQAKRDGRNLFHFYVPEMNARARQRLMLEQALRGAMAGDEFALHYQPQVDIANGQVVGFEALLRWNHDDMGQVAPSTFVPLLEETGLIIPAGQWVFSTGCRQRHDWDGMLPEQCSLSVNLSPRQFIDKNLVPQIRQVLEANALPPYQLEIELTESMLMADTEHTRSVLRALKDLGLKVSVDDFGTGYSSLAYLKQFALDALKIDKQFIDSLTCSQKDAAIARSIIQLAHNLDLQVVAEGVETASQVETLRHLGCDVVQGFYFGKPVPASEVIRLPHEMALH